MKSVLTWHYIFAEYSIRFNNINDLRPAERPSLLKISLTIDGRRAKASGMKSLGAFLEENKK